MSHLPFYGKARDAFRSVAGALQALAPTRAAHADPKAPPAAIEIWHGVSEDHDADPARAPA